MGDYLIKRNGTYYFYMRVPQSHVSKFGKFLRHTLRTQSKIEAKRICNILLVGLDELFCKIESGMLTDEKIHELISSIFTRALDAYEHIRIETPHKNQETEQFIANFPKEKLKELLSKNRTAPFKPFADMILEEAGISIDKESIQYKKLLRELLKMFSEVCAIEKERADGNFLNDYDKQQSYTKTALLTNTATLSTKKAQTSITISELFAKYKDEKKRSGQWRPKTEIDLVSYCETLIDIVGDICLDTIDHQLMLDYRDSLIKLPANRKKVSKYRDKPIDELLKMPNIEPMTLRTANNHLSTVSSLCKWAVKRGFMKANYAEGLVYRLKIKASEERSIYDKDDLMRICTVLKGINKNGSTERYWIPLIAMLSGMRMNEVCQLYKEDIKQLDGIWCIDINNEKDKNIKSVGGIRIIPIHPILLDLGLESYVKSVRSKHLWGKLKYNEKNGYAHLFQKWYQRLNRREITQDDRKTFHSFRHTFTNCLKQKGVDGQLISEIVGHSTGNITMERYGKSYKPQIMLEAMNKLDYGFDVKEALTNN